MMKVSKKYLNLIYKIFLHIFTWKKKGLEKNLIQKSNDSAKLKIHNKIGELKVNQ